MTPITAPTPTTPPSARVLLMASRRMVALDVDGTLTKDGSQDVPALTREAVTEAREAGHTVVLASGRSLIGLLPVARKLGLDGPMVASNGATGSHRAFPASCSTAGRSSSPDRCTSCAPPRIALRASGVRALIEPLRRVGLTVNPAGPDWIDVTPGGVSKASTLEDLRERLGISPECTVAVGDGLNDLEMLAWATRGVAMGHAPQEVRDAAGPWAGPADPRRRRATACRRRPLADRPGGSV